MAGNYNVNPQRPVRPAGDSHGIAYEPSGAPLGRLPVVIYSAATPLIADRREQSAVGPGGLRPGCELLPQIR